MNYNRGYIGLVALLIAVGLILYLMATQYENYASRKANRDETTQEPASLLSPIDRALDAKNAIEARDRGMIVQ